MLQGLVDSRQLFIVIEHNLDILKVADWIVELGLEADPQEDKLSPKALEQIMEVECETADYLKEAISENTMVGKLAAEDPVAYNQQSRNRLYIKGARQHNLKNISCDIAHNKTTAHAGVSGSGKSTLAFDIVFAEGQRRFMESMSAYARQFVEQMSRAEVDEVHGIAPITAIEQRVTKGTRKSTVATITGSPNTCACSMHASVSSIPR